VTRTAPVGSGYEEELRQLLRSRLILVNLLALVGGLLFVVTALLIPVGAQDPSIRPSPMEWLTFAALCVGFLGSSLALWSRPGMSLRSLRLWELLFFASFTAHTGYVRFHLLALDVPESAREDVIAFRGVFSLQAFIALVLAYGVLIPNTLRRSLLAIGAILAVAFATIPAAAVVNPVLREGHTLALAAQCAFYLTFPSAIAVFAAARASALQRRAFEAERRANELGQYTLKTKLGAGGMGEVFLAEHRLLKRACAVKFIRPELATNPATVARFTREVQAVTGLTHFNTVRVYDYGRADDGSFYYVMEYLDGPTLESLVRRAGPLDPGRVVYLLRQVCGALAEAHAAGLVHRDLKPGNMIIAALGGQRDVAKVLDFGLVQDLSATDEKLTGAGVVLGTPAYMCPEQACGSPVDARGDIYSLGAVAFFALTGRPPFERNTVGEYLTAHLTRTAPDVRELRSDVPADFAAVVARCLAKDPASRFATAAELDRALATCGCAADWSGDAASLWWAGAAVEGTAATATPTATLPRPEPTPV
jgi:serine/threonine-protein kinase